MLNLVKYRNYWERLTERLQGIDSVLPVTIDREMGRRIQSLPLHSVTLFLFPVLAESSAKNADSYGESNHCVVFVMKKYDPQRQTSFSVLEETQPVTEALKAMLLEDQRTPCFGVKIDVASMETAPETELYGTFAGWSVAFNAKTSGL